MTKLGTQVLLVDDDHALRNITQRVLTRAGVTVESVPGGLGALDILQRGRRFDVIITDLLMPGMSGTELLPRIRQLDLDVPVIVLTGNATLESAILAMEYGGFRYLQKPIENTRLIAIVKAAAAHHRLQLLKRKALEVCEAGGALLEELGSLEERFERALGALWMAFQPIVSWNARRVYGYEALVRSSDPELSSPGLLFDAAERLGRVQELGMRIRDLVSLHLTTAPTGASVFVNLHALDLTHDSLYRPESPLAPFAERVVFEVTERASLQRIDDLRGRIAQLRALGFRVAVDDLGAGYAGLSSFSQLEPEIVKLDMSLVRGVDSSSSKASLVRSMVQVCTNELGMSVVCEGVETEAEREALIGLGADLLQGYLFGRPERGFVAPGGMSTAGG